MAQFPMGGYFGRPTPQHHNNQGFGHFSHMQQRPGPMQMPNANFGPSHRNPFPPQRNMPRGAFPPQNFPQQMPPQQNMPPMHLLNPNNDPNVRFEPAPGAGAPAQNTLQAPQVSPSLNNAADIIIRLSTLTQGESNSIVFYESLARASGIADRERALVTELLENKRKQTESLTGLYRNLTNSEWTAAKDMRIEETRNFRADVSYALLQESRLLREASQIYASLDDMMHQRAMNTVLHNKIADIVHLMSLNNH